MEDKELEQQPLYLRALDENNLPYFFNLQTRTSSWSSPTDINSVIIDMASLSGTDSPIVTSSQECNTSSVDNTLKSLSSDAKNYGWSNRHTDIIQLHEEDAVTPLSGVAAAVAQGHAGLTSLRRILGTLALPKSEESNTLVEAALLHDHKIPHLALQHHHEHMSHLPFSLKSIVSLAQHQQQHQQEQHEIDKKINQPIIQKPFAMIKPPSVISTDGFSFITKKMEKNNYKSESPLSYPLSSSLSSPLSSSITTQRHRPRVPVAPLKSPPKVAVDETCDIKHDDLIDTVVTEVRESSEGTSEEKMVSIVESESILASTPVFKSDLPRVFGSALTPLESGTTNNDMSTILISNSTASLTSSQPSFQTMLTKSPQIARSVTPPRPVLSVDISKVSSLLLETTTASMVSVDPLIFSSEEKKSTVVSSSSSSSSSSPTTPTTISPFKEICVANAKGMVQSKRDYSDARFFKYFGGESSKGKVLVEHDGPKLNKHTKGSVTDDDLKRILKDLEEKAKIRTPPMLAQIVAKLLDKNTSVV